MPIVGGPVTVKRDADLDAVLGEEFAQIFGKQDTVGVDPQIQSGHAKEC